MRTQVKSDRLENLDQLFQQKSISHFDPQETVELDNPQWEYDSVFPPPKRMHEHILSTMEVADEIREEWGGPIIVVSGYRPNAYNEIVGGSPSSQHLDFRALDLKPVSRKTEDYSEFVSFVSDIVEGRRREDQIIGFGRYDTFVHIDTGFYSYQRNWNNR